MATRNCSGVAAVGYARRSTDMQERSIPDQKAFIERWAAEHGYRIIRWYVDDAISGTSTRDRDAFAELIQAAENGRDFETILCYDIARFSRGGTNETGYYLHRLKLVGVNVMFPADSIPEGDEGELLQGVKSWQARQYSVKLARDTIRGQISNIRERRSAPGGVPPYGYDKQHLTADGKVLRTLRWLPDGSKQEFGSDGKILRVIEPGTAIKKAKSDVIRFVPSTPDRVAVIRRIFDWCVAGHGYHYIAATLNNEGIRSPEGTPWNTARIGKIIANPTYRGAIAWNRRTMGSLFGVDGQGTLRPKRKKGWHLNDESDWIVSEGVHEPLVTQATFEKARLAVAKRRREGGRAKPNRSLLASFMVCKKCGHHFVLRRDRRWPGPRGEGYRYYSDAGYHRGGTSVCQLTYLPADAVDAFVLAQIKRVLIGDHTTAAKAIDVFVKALLSRRKPASNSKGIERDLDAVNRKIKATVSMLADPAFDGLDELRSTLADLKAKRDSLQARLAPKPIVAQPALDEKALVKWAAERFATLDKLLSNGDVDQQGRALIETFVIRIEVDPDAKRGVITMPADLQAALERSSNWVAHTDFMGNHEWCFYCWREGSAHVFLGPNNAVDVWSVKKVNPQSMVHLTEKPVELAVRAMQYSSRAGENVLDLFGGSGSTLIAAEQTGRHAYLMELDALYCDVIVQRWEKFTGRKAERHAAAEAAA